MNINKNAVADKERELANLLKAANQADANWKAINPTEQDLLYAREYETIKNQLTNKANELRQAQERLESLQAALTLNDLSNTGENAMAYGTNSLSTGTNAIAHGTNTIATGSNAIAIGKGSSVTGNNSIAVGVDHIVIGHNSGAFGDPNTIYGDNSYAFGNNNTIGSAATPHTVGTGTVVIGSNISTTANNSVVIGNNSTTTEDNTVSFGSETLKRKLTNVGAGNIAENSSDVATAGQLWTVQEDIKRLGNATNKADKDGSNITADGDKSSFRTNIDVYSKGEVDNKIGGINTTLGNKADANNVYTKAETYNKNEVDTKLNDKVNIADAGSISSTTLDIVGDGKVVNGSLTINLKNNAISKDKLDQDLQNEITNKANKDASNIEVNKWLEKLGTGTNIQGSNGLITGDTLNQAIKSIDVSAQITNKANTDLNNLTTDGENKIKELANSAINFADGTNTIVGSQKIGNTTTYTINISNDAIKNAVSGDLNTKANKDGSNITSDGDKSSFRTNIDVYSKGEVDNKIGGINTTLGNKADANNVYTKAETYNKNEVNTKLNDKVNIADAGSISSTTLDIVVDGKAVNGSLTINLKNNAISKDKLDQDLQNEITNKANKDASNIEVNKWLEKLGTGTISQGSTGLVTGDTVYNTVKDLQAAGNPLAISYDEANKESITLGGENGTVIRNVLTDPMDGKSAVNMGTFINSMSNMDNMFNSRISNLETNINHKINDTGALNAALTSLKPMENKDGLPWQLMAGVGHYHNKTAYAIGLAHYDSNRAMYNFGLAYNGTHTMVNGGVTVYFGKGAKYIKETVAKSLEEKLSIQQKEIESLKASLEKLEKLIKYIKQ